MPGVSFVFRELSVARSFVVSMVGQGMVMVFIDSHHCLIIACLPVVAAPYTDMSDLTGAVKSGWVCLSCIPCGNVSIISHEDQMPRP